MERERPSDWAIFRTSLFHAPPGGRQYFTYGMPFALAIVSQPPSSAVTPARPFAARLLVRLAWVTV